MQTVGVADGVGDALADGLEVALCDASGVLDSVPLGVLGVLGVLGALDALSVGAAAVVLAASVGLAGACSLLGANCGVVAAADAVALAAAVAGARGDAGCDDARALVEVAGAGTPVFPWFASLVPLNAPDTSRTTMPTVATTAALTAKAPVRHLRRSSGAPPGGGGPGTTTGSDMRDGTAHSSDTYPGPGAARPGGSTSVSSKSATPPRPGSATAAAG